MRRLTLEMPDGVRERIDEMKVLSQATSISEVVRRALSVYELLLDAEAKGGSVLIEDPSGKMRQLVIR